MNQRSVGILAVIVVVLTALALWSHRARTPDTGVDSLFLPSLATRLNDIDHVSVTKAGNELIATAELGASGWVVTNKDGYPADVAKIREPLVALSEAKILEPKTASPDLYSHLGVESIEAAEAQGVALEFEGGGEPITVILGNSEGQKYRYVRRADATQSYMIDKNPSLPKSSTEWLDPLIVDIDPARIQSISVRHSDGETLHVAKAARTDTSFTVEDVPAGRELLYASVADTMASVLKNLQLEDVASASPEDGAETSATEWRTFDGLVLTATALRIGEENWLTFGATYDPALAAAFPPAVTSAADASGSGGAAAAGDDAKTGAPAGDASTPALDPQAEAARLTEKLSGWRYRLSSYQFDQLTRRMENLLKATP